VGVPVRKPTASQTLMVIATAGAVRPVTERFLTWVPRVMAIGPPYPSGTSLNLPVNVIEFGARPE
jgi:hypothetical protein